MSRNSLRVLLPLDGSSDAESILAAIVPLAERRPLRLALLGAIAKGAQRSLTEAYLERAARALGRPDVEVCVETCLGDPVSSIIAHAISDRSDLIAMTTHGRTGAKRLLLGSVTEKVLRQAPVPLLACRPGSRMAGWAHVVALDGSPRSETILDDILPLTRLVKATIHLLHVMPGSPSSEVRTYLKHVALHCSALGVPVTTAVRRGSPDREILRYAEDVRAGIVAMATHGRTGLDRVVMGSVAEAVLRNVGCPALLRRELRKPAPVAPGVVTT